MDEATLSAELIKLRGIGEQPTPPNLCSGTMRSGKTAKVLARCVLKYYRISNRVVSFFIRSTHSCDVASGVDIKAAELGSKFISDLWTRQPKQGQGQVPEQYAH